MVLGKILLRSPVGSAEAKKQHHRYRSVHSHEPRMGNWGGVDPGLLRHSLGYRPLKNAAPRTSMRKVNSNPTRAFVSGPKIAAGASCRALTVRLLNGPRTRGRRRPKG
jgi:hypothetical protein